MNARTITIAAVAGLLVALGAGDLLAAGNGNGNRSRSGAGSAVASSTRPAGSQRRDGTFLTTGVTANGSTVRPSNGKGAQDGTCLTTTTTTSSTATAP